LSEATGRIYGFGITTPTGQLLQYLVTGKTQVLNWGVFLVLGIALGSFIAAKSSGEFRFRVPDAKTAMRNLIGGLLMGFGASISGGCTIGNDFGKHCSLDLGRMGCYAVHYFRNMVYDLLDHCSPAT
jgi:hypothetical protein